MSAKEDVNYGGIELTKQGRCSTSTNSKESKPLLDNSSSLTNQLNEQSTNNSTDGTTNSDDLDKEEDDEFFFQRGLYKLSYSVYRVLLKSQRRNEKQ